MALVGPYFIDWTPYRADFEREASRILGREVTVEGSARARLIPFPSVTFTDVTVAGETPDEAAMTVEEFSMDAELAPFLRGEVLIFDMRLVRPSAIIEIGEKGTIDWSVRPSTPYDPSQVTLESLTITEGRVTVFHRGSGRTHLLREINTQVSARSLAGPWRINGSLRLDGMLTDVSVSTGSADDGAMRVRVEASPERYPLTVRADGRARLGGEAGATYAGTFRLETTPGSGDAQGSDDASDEGPADNRFTGRFALDHTRLDVPEFRFETGPVEDPYTAEGRAFVEIGAEPRFSVTADGAQIRFEDTAGDGTKVAGLAFEDRFAAVREFLLDLPRPTIPGAIEVNLPAIVAGDTTIREIALNAEPAEDGWEVGSLVATLPGRSRFETDGHLATAGGALSYTGSLLLAVNQPSGFAAWLAKDIDDAIRRLPAAGFSADVALAEDRQTFENLELILGDARFEGSIDRQRNANARPSMELSLTGDRLDVEGMTAFASLFVGDDGTNRLADHDVDFEIKAGPVEAGGLSADSVDTALRLRERKLEIDRLTIDGLAGANISATGNLSDTESGPAGKVDATVVAVDLAPLVAKLAERFPGNPVVAGLDRRTRAYPGLLDDAEIGLVASAAENDDGTTGVALSANGVAGGTRFSLAVSGSGPSGAIGKMPFKVTVSARNDEAADLYALYGLPAVPLGLAGSADSELTLEGTLNGGGDVSFRFAGDDLEATFEGVALRDAEHSGLQGEARIETGDLEPWLAAAGATLPGFGYGLSAEIAADVRFERGQFAVSRINGLVADVPVAGDLVGRMEDDAPTITGALELDTLDLALPAAMIVGDTVLGGTAERWPSEPFRSEANAWFAADVEIAAASLSAGPAVSMSDASMQLEIGPEGLSIAQLSGKHGDAEVRGFAELKNNAGTGLLSGQIQIAGADLASSFPVHGLSGIAEISASLSASGKSVSGMVAGLSGSGSMSMRELAIEGINPDAFSPLIERADAIGHAIDAEDTVDFAPAIVHSGRFEAGEAETAIAIAGGVMRTPPLRLEDDGTVMTVEARVDLNAMTASAEGSVTYDPGLEAVAGSEPTVRFAVRGPIGGLKASLETEPLAQYLTQRALEREQARVEHMQAVLLEKQRLRRESQYYAALQDAREEARAERRRHEREVERLRREAKEKARAEEERGQAEEEERRRQAEEERVRQQQVEEEERRPQQAADEEEQRRQAEERERQEQQQGGATRVPDVQSSDTIERAPLPPPRPRDRPGQAAAVEPSAAEPESPDEVRNFFRPENLTVDGLMDIIRPRR